MRNKTLSAIVALSGLAAVAMPAGARVKKDETPLYKNASAPVEKRVNDLLSRMTLEEKIMQLNQYTLVIPWRTISGKWRALYLPRPGP